ncbi:MAG: preprotein translocase subunit SecG [Pseudomonadota bacterium]
MQTVLIVIHLMIVLALVGVVLLQRSEGGGLGIGGGGGNFMASRAAANPLARATTILGAAFFATSIALGLLARYSDPTGDVLDRIPSIGETQEDGTIPGGSGGVLDMLGGEQTNPAQDNAVPSDDGSTSGSGAPASGVPTGSEGTAPAQPAVPTE